MAKIKKESFRKLEGYQVEKDGIGYKLSVSEYGIVAIEECVPYKEAAPTVFYWDWLEVAQKLTRRPEASAHIPQPTLEQKQERAKRQREEE